MMKRLTLSIVALLLCCAVAFSQKSSPKRIVSLVPSLTESIYQLEAQHLLVGCTSYCTSAQKDNIQVVADAVQPNIERIASLRPDLVLVSELTNPKDVAALTKLGLRVENITSPNSYPEICRQFITLGRLVGKQQFAVNVVKSCNASIRELSAPLKWGYIPRVFFQIGADPIFAVMGNTFMDDFLTLLKAQNVAKDLSSGVVGREYVVAQNPDVIIIATMGNEGNSEIAYWKKYAQLKASQKDAIFLIDSKLACEPTPITFVKAFGELVNQFKRIH